jgi:hypothetical protein
MQKARISGHAKKKAMVFKALKRMCRHALLNSATGSHKVKAKRKAVQYTREFRAVEQQRN